MRTENSFPGISKKKSVSYIEYSFLEIYEKNKRQKSTET